jgi:hypothetical protein
MPASKITPKSKKSKLAIKSHVDIVFAGPLLFVPLISSGNIGGIEVFAPRNGHHLGAVFQPGVIFTDAELDDPKCDRWPEPEEFSLLDPHSYSIELSQKGKQKKLPIKAIPETNHKINPGRRLSSAWDIAITIKGELSRWSSHRLSQVTEGLFHGADTPTIGQMISSLHRLTYAGVTGADFFGASKQAREYLRTSLTEGGTLIIVGEIPYQASLLHQRQAIDSIAELAGLDLHLADLHPSAHRTQLMDHTGACGMSIVLAPRA